MDINSGTQRSLATLLHSELGGKQLVCHYAAGRTQIPVHHGHEPHDRNFLMAEEVNGSVHPAQGEISGGLH